MCKSTDLSGSWRIALDPADVGVESAWFSRELPGGEEIKLPGSIQEAGFGDPPSLDTHWTGAIQDRSFFEDPRYADFHAPESFKMPCWLTPQRVYQGACWFQRRVRLEEAGVWMELFLERCHWFTRVWLGDRELGRGDSLGTPHVFRFRTDSTGEEQLTLRVDNRLHVDVGPNAHSVSDHTQGNWNGVIGSMTLRPVFPLRMERLEVDADPQSGRIRVDAVFLAEEPLSAPLEISLRVHDLQQNDRTLTKITRPLCPDIDGGCELREEIRLPLPVAAWSPSAPNLHELELRVLSDGETLLRRKETFGFVRMEARGREFLLNSRPLRLRGTLDCAVFPDHGYPPVDVAGWERILGQVRAHGLNHVRFHSWCPPEAAFVAGDRLGVLFQIACGAWANTTSALGRGDPVDAWLYREAERILRDYGNHPCFRLMACSNEPAGPGEAGPGSDYLAGWLRHWTRRDPRRLHTGGAGWPRIPENQFHNLPEPRLHAWGAELDGHLNAQPPATGFTLEPMLDRMADRPVVSHEIGQWCVFPHPREIDSYTGFLKAGNLEIFREFLRRAGMLDRADIFHHASGRLQTLCYKFEIEAALRSPNLAGFQLLGLQDFPGQGTAPVGVLDAFWKSKPYVTAEEFREFCGDTVLLASLPRMVFQEGDPLEAEILVSHFGGADLPETALRWSLREGPEHEIAGGTLPLPPAHARGLLPLGRIRHRFAETGSPHRVKLRLELPGSGIQNRWNLYVYPRDIALPDLGNIRVMSEWGGELTSALERGESVWLRLKPRDIATELKTAFSPIFWNTAWTQGQAPHTLGILCDPSHPALAAFPTDAHSDVQWWSILRHAVPMELDRLGWTHGGIVSLIPDWNRPQPLSLAFEARVNRGRILVTSVDFDAEGDAALRQFESSLLQYWTTAPPKDLPEITPDRLRSLLK